MKTTVAFFLIANIIFAQFTPKPFVNDFKVSSDNLTSTFIQEDVKLFTNNNKEFIVTWRDFRTGLASTFAQRFDSLGNKIGINFLVNGNQNIVLNNNSSFLSVSEKYHYFHSEYFDSGSLSFIGSIYNKNNEMIRDSVNLKGGSLPWCGTGFLGISNKLYPTKDSYLYALNYDGNIQFWEIDNIGNVNNEFNFSELVNSSRISPFSFISNNNKQIVAWTNFNEYGEGLPSGIYLTFTNFSDTSNTNTFIIDEYPEDFLYRMQYNSEIKMNLLTDSTSIIFYTAFDSLKLSYVIINNNWQIVTSKKEISLNNYFSSNSSPDKRLQSFALSQINNGIFILYLSFNEYLPYPSSEIIHSNLILSFNSSGELTNTFVEENGARRDSDHNPFLISENEYYNAQIIDKDIYLIKNNKFETVVSTKINDDQIGSNEESPKISHITEDSYLISWQNETGNFAKVVDNKGVLNSPQVNLEGNQFVFLSDKIFVSSWKTYLQNYKAQTGINIYDANWNKTFSDTLFLGDNYYTNSFVKKISEEEFVVLYTNGNLTKLRLYNYNGLLLKEVEVGDGKYISQLKFYDEGTNSFWIMWNNSWQLISNSLEKLSQPADLYANLYLGNNKFLLSQTEYPNRTIGFVLSVAGDTLVNKFTIAENVGNLVFEKITDYKFLAIYSKNTIPGIYYARVFYTTGVPENKEFMITTDNPKYMKDISVLIKNNDLIFTWSDLRSGNLGFDTYCNIFKLDNITGIIAEGNRNNLPTQFSLSQNYPNPFNPTTTIEYSVPYVETNSHIPIQLKIYDVLGREITTLVNQPQKPGIYKTVWNATNFSSGIYYYSLRFDNNVYSKKMLLLK